MALRPGIKKFDSIRNVLIPDYSFDSDLEEKVFHWRVSVDSDYVIMKTFESDFFAAMNVAGGILDSLDSESKKGQRQQLWIDSESKRVSNHYYEVQKLLDSEYIKNRELLAGVTTRLDSDELAIQAAKTQINNLLDSEYIKNRQWFAYAQQRMDSDELSLQNAKTHLENLLDSEYRKNADWFAYAELRMDSDEQKLQDNLTTLENRIDSEYRKNADWFAYAQQKFDSDELAIQTNLNTLHNLLDSEYRKNADWFDYAERRFDSEYRKNADWFDYAERRFDSEYRKSADWYAYAEARLDSDESFLQYISTNYTKTVNGIKPDVNNNVILSIVGVQTGTEDQKRDSLASGLAKEGLVWVTSGDSDALNDGKSYIFDSDAFVYRRISGFDFSQADARYVNLSGDTMSGGLTVPSLQVNSGEIVSVSPTVTLNGAVTGTGTLTNLNDVSITTTHTADPTLTLTGDVSGSATFTNLGDASLAVTLTKDPVVTLSGAVTGSATMSNLGDVTIATTHTADPVITLSGAVTGTGTMTNLGSVTITTTATNDPTLTLAGDVTGTATFTNLGNATLTAVVVESNVNHDLLSNFVANEHIDHTTVSVTAGNGLTGGGTIAATRSLAVQAANTSITVGASGIAVSEGNVNHDSLNGFVANEHVDHSNVSVLAGAGLTGGGTITTDRTLNVVGGNGITVNANDVTMSGAYTGNFTVTGTVFATIDVTVTSDERLKSNVQTIDATKAFEMRGVHYDIDGRSTSGVIAQEIEKIAPELVHENDEGFKSVAYGPVVAYLIEAVKNLNERVKELESK